MAVQRIQYEEKSSDSNADDAVRKFFDADANEIKQAINNNADELDLLIQAAQTPTPSVGPFTSLALLTQAYPNGAGNAFCVIDAGNGATPQIAVYDVTENEWQISGSVLNFPFFPSFSQLPQPGLPNTLYTTTDNFYTYLWYNNNYNLLNSQTSTTYNTLFVKEVTTSPLLGTGSVAVSFIYSAETSKITKAVFNGNYSKYLYEVRQLLNQKNFEIKFYNITQKTVSIAKITALDYTDNTDVFFVADLENTIDQSNFQLSDKVIVEVSVSGLSSGGSNAYDPTNAKVISPAATTNQLALDEVDLALEKARGTEVLSGALVTLNIGGTTVDVSATKGQIKGVNGYFNIDYPGETNYTLTNTVGSTYIYIDQNNTLQQQATIPTRADFRNKLFLTRVAFVNNVIAAQEELINPAGQYINALRDYLSYVSSPKEGLAISPNANLTFSRAAGSIFELGGNFVEDSQNPNSKPFSSVSPATFFYQNRSAIFATGQTNINVTQYNSSGTTLTTMTNNRFRIDTVYIFTSGNITVQLGQNQYSSLDEAETAIATRSFVKNPANNNGTRLGWIIVQKDATDLQNTAQARFKQDNGSFSTSTTTVGALLASNNLSDLLNVANAQFNLGLSGPLNQITINTSNITNKVDKPNASAGTLIVMNKESGTAYNMSAPNANIKLFYINTVLLGKAIILVNAAAEPYLTSNANTIAGNFVTGKQYTIESVGNTDFTAIGASANTVDTRFVATGPGTGTGEASLNAVKINGDAFVADTNIYLYAFYNGVEVQYKFISILQVSSGGFVPRTYIETFSVSGGVTVNTDDWWSAAVNFRGKYNLTFAANASITDTNDFSDERIGNSFQPIVPFKCKIKNAWVSVYHNGGSGSMEYAIKSYEVTGETVNANFDTSQTNHKIIAQKTLPSNIAFNLYKFSDTDMDKNHVVNQNSLLTVYFRRISTSNIPLQRLNITVEFEEIQ